MKTLTSVSLLAVSLFYLPLAQAEEPFKLDAAHTDVAFKVRHLAVSYTRGSFQAVAGTLALDPKDIGKSSVDIRIDVASIDTANEKRDNHLRSPDFFDAAKYPSMHFVSTRVYKAKRGLRVDGKLTLHGVSRVVTLEIEDMSPAVVGPYGFERRGFTATAKIDRRDFGLMWSKALETGGLVVGYDVYITIEAEFMRKPTGDGA